MQPYAWPAQVLLMPVARTRPYFFILLLYNDKVNFSLYIYSYLNTELTRCCILPNVVFLRVWEKYQFLKHWNFTRTNADCQYVTNPSMCQVQALHTLTSEKLVSSQPLLSVRKAQAANIWVVWNKQRRVLASSALKQAAKFCFLVFHSAGKEPQVSSKR